MDVLASFDGEHHIKPTIRNRVDNFIWSLVAISGAAQDVFKANFFVSWLILQRTINIQFLSVEILICLDSNMRRVKTILIAIGLSCLTLSSIA
jgi:hypothetical protein